MAYSKATYEYIRTKQDGPPPPRLTSTHRATTVEISDDEDDRSDKAFTRVASQALVEEDAGDEEEDDKFKLRFKSAKTQGEIVLVVRPSTTCGAILKAFIKKAGLADQYPHVMDPAKAIASAPKKKGRGAKAAAPAPLSDPRLCVDGDRMANATPISEVDLEEGDMVDIVGL